MAYNKEYEIPPSALPNCLRHFSYSRNVVRNQGAKMIDIKRDIEKVEWYFGSSLHCEEVAKAWSNIKSSLQTSNNSDYAVPPTASPKFDLQCTKCGRKWKHSDMVGTSCCGKYAKAL